MNEFSGLYEHLKKCTVLIENDIEQGTGFFVAPGQILTCSHVVRPDLANTISYGGHTYQISQIKPGEIFPDYPDLALVHIEFYDHPCVALGVDIDPFTRIYSYGYTQENINGEPVTVDCEGVTGGEQPLIKFKAGQVIPGSSGSPLLNCKTGYVCGMMKSTRDRSQDLGGEGVPANIIKQFLPDVFQANINFHKNNDLWELYREGHVASATYGNVAVLYKEPGVIKKPTELIGRKSLLEKIYRSLQEKHFVLLGGMGGIGKTALALEVADKFLHGKQFVIWLHFGYSDAESVIESLADCCEERRELLNKQGDNKYLALREILKKSTAKLIIFDDVRNIAALKTVSQGIPTELPVLITSRVRFDFVDEIVEVSHLDMTASLKLLGHASGDKNYRKDMSARRLCEQLGFHPYALGIAGANIKVLHSSPGELGKNWGRSYSQQVKTNQDPNPHILAKG